MAPKKKTLKASRAVTKPAHKPKCRDHAEEMKFNPLRMIWECPLEECKMVAHPPEEVGGKRSIGLEGEFEAIVVTDRLTGDEKVVIRKEKVYFDVTQHVSQAVQTDTGFMVTLVFDNALRFDEDGNLM